MGNITLINDVNNQVSIDWDDLYYDLKKEKAVLIMGPEFFTKDGVSQKEILYRQLIQRPDHGILHFYPSNGIFLFKSQLYKTKSQKIASQFYESLTSDNAILEKIIELPFRLIINTNPDKILENKYKAKNLQCQFDYFTWRPKKNMKETTDPDNYNPLIFNLFGSVDSHESIILDFEDLFEHLRTLLNNTNVPDGIRSILNDTDSYIFIGFQLERWDTQLMFRYLNMKNGGFDDRNKNYTTKSLNIDLDSESFFREQFNLKYYGVPIEFLDEMHKKYFEMAVNEDKKLIEEMSPKNLVEEYISLDQVQKALNFLTIYINENKPELAQTLIMIKSNFSRYMHLNNRRLENPGDLEIKRARIKQSILDITNLF